MSTILITGASGLIGRALATALSKEHDVRCMSRRNPELGLPWVKGAFSSFEDLRQLDGTDIDTVVHLAAATGLESERDCLLVNVEGTRVLMRYLADRGCRKFVMASSIAAVGMQSTRFRPLQVPIPDDHPCLDRDGYGFSKSLMEQVTAYVQRQIGNIDVINLRLASVPPDDQTRAPVEPGPVPEWSVGHLTIMRLRDAVRAFTLAAEAPHRPGVRAMNCAAPTAWTKHPVAEVLRSWWGHDVDVSHFERTGHERDAVYDVGRIEQELGFVAETITPR